MSTNKALYDDMDERCCDIYNDLVDFFISKVYEDPDFKEVSEERGSIDVTELLPQLAQWLYMKGYGPLIH